MNLKQKINLFIFASLSILTLLLVTTSHFIIRQMAIETSTNTFNRELDNIELNIRESYKELESIGLLGVDSYVNSEKQRLLQLFNSFRYGKSGQLFVLNQKGAVLIHRSYLPGTQIENDFVKTMLHEKQGNIWYEDKDQDWFAIYRPSPHWDWLMVLAISREEMLSHQATYLSLALPIALLLFLAIFLITQRVSRQFSKEIERILKALQRVESGDMTARLDNIAHDDLGKVQKGINSMIESVAQRSQELSEARDLLEARVAERTAKLKHSNARLRSAARFGHIVENSLNEIYVFDSRSLKFSFVNHGARNNLGYSMEELSELTPLALKPRFTPETFEAQIRPLREKKLKVLLFDTVHQRKDGTLYDVEIHLQLMHDEDPPVFVAIIQDITERKRMHGLMMQTEKMMSVGGLAAGMAHELNNPLGGILQGLQNVKRRLSTDLENNLSAAEEIGIEFDKMQAYLDRRGITGFLQGITESGERASKIVNNMLMFSRKPDESKSPALINEVIEQTLALAAVDYDLKKKFDFRNIRILREYDTSIPPIPCIASEIQQVLLNLFRNAAQAFSGYDFAHREPTITIRTIKQMDMARIEVEDNGPGMEHKVSKRIFEPFYTTRPIGEGTGLGLSISYFIVTDEHGGNLSVESIPGQKTKFIIELPLLKANKK